MAVDPMTHHVRDIIDGKAGRSPSRLFISQQPWALVTTKKPSCRSLQPRDSRASIAQLVYDQRSLLFVGLVSSCRHLSAYDLHCNKST